MEYCLQHVLELSAGMPILDTRELPGPGVFSIGALSLEDDLCTFSSFDRQAEPAPIQHVALWLERDLNGKKTKGKN